mmetsp:Transcript_20845/g.65575  ORF Transcript_20845/g.65575 Transcript_20845/m.65575 type:complete len:278 (-) Transcript_20845:1701-2534(-)
MSRRLLWYRRTCVSIQWRIACWITASATTLTLLRRSRAWEMSPRPAPSSTSRRTSLRVQSNAAPAPIRLWVRRDVWTVKWAASALCQVLSRASWRRAGRLSMKPAQRMRHYARQGRQPLARGLRNAWNATLGRISPIAARHRACAPMLGILYPPLGPRSSDLVRPARSRLREQSSASLVLSAVSTMRKPRTHASCRPVEASSTRLEQRTRHHAHLERRRRVRGRQSVHHATKGFISQSPAAQVACAQLREASSIVVAPPSSSTAHQGSFRTRGHQSA